MAKAGPRMGRTQADDGPGGRSRLTRDQIVEAAMADEGLRRAAAVNPGDKFELVFKNVLESLFSDRMDQNEEIFVRFMKRGSTPSE